nr:MAG TPA: hypothetical protein [Caudoviricetes sp.]
MAGLCFYKRYTAVSTHYDTEDDLFSVAGTSPVIALVSLHSFNRNYCWASSLHIHGRWY